VSALWAQELPPVSIYTPNDYLADNQNWSISQDSWGHIFVANNKGLLEFDGVNWRVYPSPNESIIRSVYCIKDTVYTGCYRDFGFWTRDSTGFHQYTSLLKGRSLDMREDEQIWKIVEFEDHIIFQSLSSLYIYQPKSNSIKKHFEKNGITRVFHIRNNLYVAVPGKGIYSLNKEGMELKSNADVFTSNLVVGMYEIKGEVFVQMNTGGVIQLEEPEKKWGAAFFDRLDEVKVYSSYQSKNGGVFIGTVSQGVFCLNEKGELQYQMNRTNSISNNTILNIFEDRSDNIWLALDNGVNVAHQSSPVRIFYDESGEIGTVYSSTLFNGRLYLGTNQGLFYRDIGEKKSGSFHLVRGSIGQVWTLFKYNGELFCGHDNGTYLVGKDHLKLVDDFAGTWCFRPFPNDFSRILVGHYKGLSIMEYSGSKWEMDGPLENYDFSSRYVEFISDSVLLINHEYKGVYRVEVNLSRKSETILAVEKDTSVERGLYSSLSMIDGRPYYAYEGGVYYYLPTKHTFFLDSVLTELVSMGSYSSGKIIPTANGGAWMFSDRGIHLIRPGKIKAQKEILSIPIPNHRRNAMLGYENILQMDYGKFLFGQAGGYFLFNLDKYQMLSETVDIRLRSAKASNVEGEVKHLPLMNDEVELSSNYNSVSFRFSIPDFNNYFLTEYQYKLDGYHDNWSHWQGRNTFEVTNLPYGDYVLHVRGRTGEQKSRFGISYNFSIDRPFWLSKSMIVVYFVIGALLLIGIHFKYKRYFDKQREQEQRRNLRKHKLAESENKRKFIRLQNEKLQQEIEAKNRELAISTMGIIKKNRLLNKIKKELRQADNRDNQIGKVIKIIDTSLKSNDDWEYFEKAFNDADKDFFKKVKENHPDLTSNDLRFCAYLRLNLSSKEIAPLLSISPKSVEVKRYRLRKKMELDSDTNLTAYILSI
jgi:DNA-binding CsgD family transcriptional regulator